MARAYGRRFKDKQKTKYATADLDGHKFKYKKGGFHKTTDTPDGETIPKWKWKKALAGGYGKKGEQQAKTGLALQGKTAEEYGV